MKKMGRLALILLLLTSMLVAVAACKGDKVSEISVSESGMKLLYVLGEDIDPSASMLTVKEGDSTKEIPMSSEGVSISGFDKNKLGEQIVTISYGGKTTEITVTVVERMTVVNAISDYLIGDSLNTSKGSVKVIKDDGTSYSVNFNNAGVSFEGFDSSAAVNGQTVKVKYVDGANTYEAYFKVNIHSVDDVSFKKPNKIAYNSHESWELDLSGSYLTLKGNGGKLEKDIQITKDMISGFDPSVVNASNTPYTQTVTVTYGNLKFNYDVKLTYTDISMFNDNVDAFLALDWSGEDFPQIPEDIGALALDLMQRYLNLSKAQTNFIEKKSAIAVARTALLYGMEKIEEDQSALEDAFTLYNGQILLTGESYEAVENAIIALQNKDSNLYTVTPILTSIIDAFAEDEIIEGEGITFNYFAMVGAEVYDTLIDMFEYQIKLYDSFSAIPDNWQSTGVERYADRIQEIWTMIQGSGYTDVSSAQIYSTVSYWRTNNDVFDILYEYYYGLGDDDVLVELSYIGLPYDLEEVFYHISMAMTQMTSISQMNATDTSVFFYNYYAAIKLAEQVKANGDPMIKDLYATLQVNGMFGMNDNVVFTFDDMLEYLTVSQYGFQYCAGALLGIDAYHTLLDKYMDIVIKLYDENNEDYASSAAYGEDIEAMFAMYLALSPSQQISFLGSLSPFYSLGYIPFAFDDTEDTALGVSLFVQLVNEYYRSKFTGDVAISAYNDLVIAMEIYAQRASYGSWINDFTSRISSVTSAYQRMNDNDKAAFTLALGSVYTECLDISKKYSGTVTKPSLGEWEDDFLALKKAIESVEQAYSLMYQGNYTYNLFFSAYERVNSISSYILNNAPDEIVKAYYHDDLYVIEYSLDGVTTERMELTYDYMVSIYRTMYITYLISFMDGYDNIYDIYGELNMGEFLDKTYDLFWAYLLADEDPATLVFDKDKVLDVMKAFSQMTEEQKMLFMIMEGENDFYYTIMSVFIEEAFTEKAAVTSLLLMEIEQYLIYSDLQNNSELVVVKNTLSQLKESYRGLSGEDKASFSCLEELYSFYVEKCEGAIAEAE